MCVYSPSMRLTLSSFNLLISLLVVETGYNDNGQVWEECQLHLVGDRGQLQCWYMYIIV